VDARCRNWANELGQPPFIVRRRLVFERLLERLASDGEEEWVLRGGLSLVYLRGGRGRPTRDMDLWVRAGAGDPAETLLAAVTALRRAAELGCDDGFALRVIAVERAQMEKIGGVGAGVTITSEYLGSRFEEVHVDLSVADALVVAPVSLAVTPLIPGREVFRMSGIAPEQTFSEKCHAMTRTYGAGRGSTRPRDLVDLAAMALHGDVDRSVLCAALWAVFDERGTHELPEKLALPAGFENAFREYGAGYGLAGMTAEEGLAIVQATLDDAVGADLPRRPGASVDVGSATVAPTSVEPPSLVD
jgi:hypothetical protein